MDKIVLIFGASSGIGLASARLFLDKGCTVINCSRRNTADERIKDITADTSSSADIDNAFSRIEREYCNIDIMIYCSGFSMAAPIEDVMEKDYRYLFEVNVFGAICAVKKSAALMRKGKGRIVLISSLAGAAVIPYDPYYCASKAALNTLTVALATELDKKGIAICSVLPGGVATPFTFARKVYHNENKDFAAAVKWLAYIEQNGMSAEKVALRVYKSATKKYPPLLISAGVKNNLAYIFCKILPARLIKTVCKAIFKTGK